MLILWRVCVHSPCRKIIHLVSNTSDLNSICYNLHNTFDGKSTHGLPELDLLLVTPALLASLRAQSKSIPLLKKLFINYDAEKPSGRSPTERMQATDLLAIKISKDWPRGAQIPDFLFGHMIHVLNAIAIEKASLDDEGSESEAQQPLWLLRPGEQPRKLNVATGQYMVDWGGVESQVTTSILLAHFGNDEATKVLTKKHSAAELAAMCPVSASLSMGHPGRDATLSLQLVSAVLANQQLLMQQTQQAQEAQAKRGEESRIANASKPSEHIQGSLFVEVTFWLSHLDLLVDGWPNSDVRLQLPGVEPDPLTGQPPDFIHVTPFLHPEILCHLHEHADPNFSGIGECDWADIIVADDAGIPVKHMAPGSQLFITKPAFADYISRCLTHDDPDDQAAQFIQIALSRPALRHLVGVLRSATGKRKVCTLCL